MTEFREGESNSLTVIQPISHRLRLFENGAFDLTSA
jgi:hypothetical protein